MEGNEAFEDQKEEDVDDPEQDVHLITQFINVGEEESGSEAIPPGSELCLSALDGSPLTLANESQWSYLAIADQEEDGVAWEDGNTVEENKESLLQQGKMILLNGRILAYIQEPSQGEACQVIPIDDGSEALLTVTQPEEAAEELKLRKRPKTHSCIVAGCTKAYSSVHHLKVHIRNHFGERPYSCSDESCDKAFTTVYSLKAHLRTHTGEKPYSCPVVACPKSFKTSGDLQKHIRTHTGERPFVCPVEGCNKSFTTSNIRKVHIRTHTGERPYVCDQPDCYRSFASLTNYKNHVRIHSGEKPYACPVASCDKRFTEYSSLYKHQWVHSQERRYKCDLCPKSYRQTTTLASHRRTVHGVIAAQDGTQLILERVIGLGADGSTSFKNIASNLLNLKRQSSALITLKDSEDSDDSYFIISEGNEDGDLQFEDDCFKVDELEG